MKKNALSYLNLSRSNIKLNGVIALSKALKNENCKLKYLNLSANTIPSKGLSYLLKSLKYNSCLKTLNINRIKFDSEGVNISSQFIKRNQPTLTQLLMNGNQIGDFGAQNIFEALKQNTTLTKLGLSSNNIKSKTCIKEAIEINKTIHVLWLSGNKFSKDTQDSITQSWLKTREGIPDCKLIFYKSLSISP